MVAISVSDNATASDATSGASFLRGKLTMRTLHTSYRVSELDVSLAFYTALGYEQVGLVDLRPGARLTMLKFPSHELVTLELVHRPVAGPVDISTVFSHLPVQVYELAATLS